MQLAWAAHADVMIMTQQVALASLEPKTVKESRSILDSGHF